MDTSDPKGKAIFIIGSVNILHQWKYIYWREHFQGQRRFPLSILAQSVCKDYLIAMITVDSKCIEDGGDTFVDYQATSWSNTWLNGYQLSYFNDVHQQV